MHLVTNHIEAVGLSLICHQNKLPAGKAYH